MRAMVFDRYGEPDVMHLKDVPVPEPQDGEVLIPRRLFGCQSSRFENSARAPHARTIDTWGESPLQKGSVDGGAE